MAKVLSLNLVVIMARVQKFIDLLTSMVTFVEETASVCSLVAVFSVLIRKESLPVVSWFLNVNFFGLLGQGNRQSSHSPRLQVKTGL